MQENQGIYSWRPLSYMKSFCFLFFYEDATSLIYLRSREILFHNCHQLCPILHFLQFIVKSFTVIIPYHWIIIQMGWNQCLLRFDLRDYSHCLTKVFNKMLYHFNHFGNFFSFFNLLSPIKIWGSFAKTQDKLWVEAI